MAQLIGSINPDVFGLYPNGVLGSGYGRNASLQFSGNLGNQFLETTALNVGDPSFIQFDLNTGWTGATSAFTIEVQYADNYGANSGNPVGLSVGSPSGTPWQYVLGGQCDPAAASQQCTNWTWTQPPGTYSNGYMTFAATTSWSGASIFYSYDYATDYWGNGSWTRITLPLPAGSGPTRRYRIVAQRSTTTSTWGISNLYIGVGCSGGCNNKGYCVAGTCVCDAGMLFVNNTCVSQPGLLTVLRESFETALLPVYWSYINGGSTSGTVVSGGQSFQFNGAVSRRLVTVDMDTRNATYMEFTLQMSQEQSSNSQVLTHLFFVFLSKHANLTLHNFFYVCFGCTYGSDCLCGREIYPDKKFDFFVGLFLC